MIRLKSSSGKRGRLLAGSPSSGQAKDFLVTVANLRDDKDGLRRLRSRFPDVLDQVNRTMVATYSPKVYRPGSPEHDEWARKSWLMPLRDTLRAIWQTPDPRAKEWGLFRISQDFFLQGHPDMIQRSTSNGTDFLLSWEPPTRTEQFLLELMKWADFLRYCANPDCAAPYFIAAKRDQKYCHTECARPTQRESKRRWWAKNGKQWRAGEVKKPK
jgi:hypothetical protein